MERGFTGAEAQDRRKEFLTKISIDYANRFLNQLMRAYRRLEETPGPTRVNLVDGEEVLQVNPNTLMRPHVEQLELGPMDCTTTANSEVLELVVPCTPLEVAGNWPDALHEMGLLQRVPRNLRRFVKLSASGSVASIPQLDVARMCLRGLAPKGDTEEAAIIRELQFLWIAEDPADAQQLEQCDGKPHNVRVFHEDEDPRAAVAASSWQPPDVIIYMPSSGKERSLQNSYIMPLGAWRWHKYFLLTAKTLVLRIILLPPSQASRKLREQILALTAHAGLLSWRSRGSRESRMVCDALLGDVREAADAVEVEGLKDLLHAGVPERLDKELQDRIDRANRGGSYQRDLMLLLNLCRAGHEKDGPVVEVLDRLQGVIPPPDRRVWLGIAAAHRLYPVSVALDRAAWSLAAAPEDAGLLKTFEVAGLAANRAARTAEDARMLEASHAIGLVKSSSRFALTVSESLRVANNLDKLVSSEQPGPTTLVVQKSMQELERGLVSTEQALKALVVPSAASLVVEGGPPIPDSPRELSGLVDAAPALLQRCRAALERGLKALLTANLEEAVAGEDPSTIREAMEAARSQGVQLDARCWQLGEDRLEELSAVAARAREAQRILEAEAALRAALDRADLAALEAELAGLDAAGRSKAVGVELLAASRALLGELRERHKKWSSARQARWASVEEWLAALKAPRYLPRSQPERRDLLRRVLLHSRRTSEMEKKLGAFFAKLRDKRPDDYLQFLAALKAAHDREVGAEREEQAILRRLRVKRPRDDDEAVQFLEGLVGEDLDAELELERFGIVRTQGMTEEEKREALESAIIDYIGSLIPQE